MKPGALVAMPNREVGVVHSDCGAQRSIVKPISGARTEAFAWTELVELRDARPIEHDPRAIVQTEWGQVEVIATGAEQTVFGKAGTDLVILRAPQDEHLRINRVEYSLHAEIVRCDDGWRSTSYTRLYRRRGEVTGSAQKVVRTQLEPLIFEWLDANPWLLRRARRKVLSNEIAKTEGRILAAKIAYQEAVEARERLLGQEETDMVPFLLDLLAPGKT